MLGFMGRLGSGVWFGSKGFGVDGVGFKSGGWGGQRSRRVGVKGVGGVWVEGSS